MTYNQALEYIHSLGMFSHPAGLERIKKVCERLGNPQNGFRAVHIAGTNGKGSVATFCAAAFEAQGLKVGLFTSPYIIEFRERIRINGEFITEDELAALTQEVKNTDIELTEFEFITAVCFLYFARKRVDIAVIEVGLGGRFDATNVLPSPAVSVITRIGLDHTAVLGDTIEKIAGEKCGIIKNNTVITSPEQPPEALEVIKSSAERLIIPKSEDIKILSIAPTGNRFIYKGTEFLSHLAGEHQICNAVTAIEALRALNISEDAIKKGLDSAFVPARLELISKNPQIMLDGAHNPDGAAVLAEFMKKTTGKITAIIGMVRDKDCRAVLRQTLPLCSSVITVKAADMPRALSAEELAAAARDFCSDVIAAQSYSEAIDIALEKSSGGAIFAFGSLYLAAGIRPIFNKKVN